MSDAGRGAYEPVCNEVSAANLSGQAEHTVWGITMLHIANWRRILGYAAGVAGQFEAEWYYAILSKYSNYFSAFLAVFIADVTKEPLIRSHVYMATYK
jgi:hypothetical protein